jgi:hypothetical protein
LEPREAAAMIFFLVSGEGRLSLVGEAGVALAAAAAFLRGPRTVALTLAVDLTMGNFTVLVAVRPRPVVLEVAVVSFAAFPRLVFLMAFLTPVRSLRLLPPRDGALSTASAILRFLPATFFAFAFFRGLSASSLTRSLSLGRGPRIPRQLDAPQRHCWTFLLEYGLLYCQYAFLG